MPTPAAREVGSNEEFIEDMFGAVEHEFTQHFGQKWSPEINELFQSSLDTCRKVALALDERATGVALEAAARVPRVRRLTNRHKRA